MNGTMPGINTCYLYIITTATPRTWSTPLISNSHSTQALILSHHLKVPSANIQIQRNGKPKCSSHRIEFSVAHTTVNRHQSNEKKSKNTLANTTFAMAISSQPIGLDVECIHRRIPWAIFNRNRAKPIRQFETPPWPQSPHCDDFNKVFHWTRWEATVKLTGKVSTFQLIRQFLTSSDLFSGKI